jgi:hypothetical protein
MMSIFKRLQYLLPLQQQQQHKSRKYFVSEAFLIEFKNPYSERNDVKRIKKNISMSESHVEILMAIHRGEDFIKVFFCSNKITLFYLFGRQF